MSPCPAEPQLKQLLADELPPAESAAAQAHVNQCPHCQQALERLSADPLVRPATPAGAAAPTPLLDLRGDKPRNPRPEAQPEVTSTFEPEGTTQALDLTFLQPAGRPDALGRLGHYEVLEVLGRGGFGIVLKAFDESLRRVVAIKVLAPDMAATSPARKRFLREARAAAQVRHENVVQVHAIEEEPLPYLVMEYIPGETLQQRMEACGPLPADAVVRFGVQIARGLAAAHAMGLIHRDVKPGNVLLERGFDERVKLTDFGLARAADDASLTQSGVLAGTPLYMAPEQARGEQLDHRADLFSLGSLLYTMCSGRPPFRAANSMAVMKRVCEDTPRPIREIIPEVPQWLCDVIAKLQVKDPAQRFQTAAEVAEILGRCQASPPSHAAPVAPARSRRRAALVGGVVVLGLVGAGAVYWATRGAPDASTPPTVARADEAKQTPPVAVGHPIAKEKPRPSAPPAAKAPFTTEEARAHQEAWARHLGTDVVTTNSLDAKMVLIPPGEFLMGSTNEQRFASRKILDTDTVSDPGAEKRLLRESPQHRVVLTRPYLMGATEVTVGQFRQFVEAAAYETEVEKAGFGNSVVPIGEKDPANTTRRDWRDPGPKQTDASPVCQITWNDACAFCVWLSEQEKLTPWYQKDDKGQWQLADAATGYRLPTEAEWEHACRAGTTTLFSFGDNPAALSQYAWHSLHPSAASPPVGEKLPNPFGLYDMHGGAAELCQDALHEEWYRLSPVFDPVQTVKPSAWVAIVNRGGSRTYGAIRCRSASRVSYGIAARYWTLGFRVVRPLSVPTAAPAAGP